VSTPELEGHINYREDTLKGTPDNRRSVPPEAATTNTRFCRIRGIAFVYLIRVQSPANRSSASGSPCSATSRARSRNKPR
jgi:hypothetical protein